MTLEIKGIETIINATTTEIIYTIDIGFLVYAIALAFFVWIFFRILKR